MEDTPIPSAPLTASEALYGFYGWLTSRDQEITLSAHHDAAPIAEMIKAFCIDNKIAPPRDGWEKLLDYHKE